MKKLNQLKQKNRIDFPKDYNNLVRTINKLVVQHNETIEEIRLIKKKLRVNAHFGRG